MNNDSSSSCLYPFILSPVGKDYLWGGQRLRKEFNKQFDIDPIAETWECSTHPDGTNIIANGCCKGMSLKDVIEANPDLLGLSCRDKKDVPILIKLIDANKDLSVQVHPDDDYAMKHENDYGKTEMWYIIDAVPGAEIVYGFEHPVTPEIIRRASLDKTINKHLHRVPVKKGDSFLISAGTVHAIGAGILIAEIQERSNVTYRVYDYDRIDKNGNKRQLHIEKALDVLNMDAGEWMAEQHHLVRYSKGVAEEELCDCKYFKVHHINCNDQYDMFVGAESFQTILCLDGSAIINAGSCNVQLHKGECAFLPANVGELKILGTFEMLKVTL